jgi:acyl-CoA synthetase (AMP-forming)/AMP-acid ligase II
VLIGDIVRRNAVYYPERDAVVVPGAESRTWADLDARTNRLANVLLALGLTKEDRVAILAPNCAEYVEWFFSCAKSGIAGVATNVKLADAELASFYGYVRPSVVLVHADFAARAGMLEGAESVVNVIGFGGEHGFPLDLEELLAQTPDADPGCAVGEDDAYQLAATSGTTGVMKAAIITHRNATAGMLNFLAEQPVPAEGTFLQNTPFYFGPGGPANLHPVLMKGGRTVVAPAFRPADFLRLVEEHRVTNTTLVPTMMKMVLDDPLCETCDVSSVKAVTMGGSPVTRDLLRRARAIFGDVFFPWYGLTETSSCGLSLRREDQHLEGSEENVRRLGSLGKPHVSVQVRVVDADGRDVPHDGQTHGEIWIAGDTVSPSYFERPDETAATYEGPWFKTGDVAVVDADAFVTLVDRTKDIIITGGINVFSREVEDAISSHPAVADVAVIGVPHERWGEAVHAVVVRRPGAAVEAEEIIGHVAARLAPYKKPQSVDFVDALPLSATGKLVKRELRARYSAGGAPVVG